MRRQRRVWRRPSEPSPLDRATTIGVALPSFNFIEPKVPVKRPPSMAATVTLPSIVSSRQNNSLATDTNGDAPIPPLDGDAIVYHTLVRYANELDEPTMSEEGKLTRLWQSLQRHSEAGRFSSQLSAYAPNPICSFLAIEIIQQILEASGVSLMLINLLIGAIGNSIFQGYEPEKEKHELKQYADVARDLNVELSRTSAALAACKMQPASHKSQLAAFALEERDSSMEDKARLVTAVYRSVEGQGMVSGLILETLVPFFSDELLLLLWNAIATVSATQRLSEDSASLSDNHKDESTLTDLPATRKRASFMATRVLHERVRLMLTLWQTMSVEEKDAVCKSLITTPQEPHGSSSPLGLQDVLQTLEEVYVNEQVRGRSSPRRSMFLSPTARRASVFIRQDGLSPSPSVRQRLTSSRLTLPPTLEQHTLPAPTNVSIPDVLLGALTQGQHVAATDTSQLAIEQLSNDQDEILRQCEDIFDVLCEDPAAERIGVLKPGPETPHGDAASAQVIVNIARERLCGLLCQYVDAPSFIMEKFEASRAQRELREPVSEDDERDDDVVQMLIQRQRQNPALLVTAINQHPEILLSAIAHNNGILRFAMTRFPPLVKSFLRLDLKACDYLDQLALKHKGIQLLWGTSPTTMGSAAIPLHAQASSTGRASVGEALVDAKTSRRSSVISRGVVLTPGELHLLEWFQAHTEDLALLSLKKPDVLKPLLVEMHTSGDVATFHKVMLQLASTKGFQAFVQRSSVATLEKIAQEDPAEVGRLLREIFRDPGNQDLLHQLRSSPYLVTCLSELHPTVIHDVMASDLETWRHYFVETVSANDAMLKEILITRTEHLHGGETLVRLYSAVVSGDTTGLNLQALDFTGSSVDGAFAQTRDGLSRRKRAQCLYLRGGASVFRALVAPLIATVGFHPHEITLSYAVSSSSTCSPAHGPHASTTVTGHASTSRGKPKKAPRASSGSRMKKRLPPRPTHAKQDDQTPATSDGGATSLQATRESLVETMPRMWQSFAMLFLRQHPPQHEHRESRQLHAPLLTLAHAKTLVLDVWIEFLKVDTVQLDSSCLYSLAPFVCDYLVTRYDSPRVVGAWLVALSEAMASFPNDPRIAFFASCCGTHSPASSGDASDGYDTFLYYAHALSHLLFGHMKIFKPDCRLEETSDGNCAVDKRFVIATAARLFDHRLLSGPEMDELLTRLEQLSPVMPATTTEERVELDDAMGVFLDQWRLVNAHMDERYRQAFASHDPTGSHRIGLEQFIKIVTSVTQQSVSPRDCLLVFCDVGLELLDVETLVRVTRVYHLRLFNAYLPEVALDETDFHELSLSVGCTNIVSPAREVEDLHRFWKGLRGDIYSQMDALHQNKQTKMQLKKQSALVERLLQEMTASLQAAPPPRVPGGGGGGGLVVRPRSQQQQQRTLTGPQMIQKAWTELRACAKMLQSAKLTQHYLSRLYIQTCIVRWVRLMRKKRQEQGHCGTELLPAVAAVTTEDSPRSHKNL